MSPHCDDVRVVGVKRGETLSQAAYECIDSLLSDPERLLLGPDCRHDLIP